MDGLLNHAYYLFFNKFFSHYSWQLISSVKMVGLSKSGEKGTILFAGHLTQNQKASDGR